MGVVTSEMLIRFFDTFPEIDEFIRRLNSIQNPDDCVFYSDLAIWQILINTKGVSGVRTDREVLGTISRLEYICQKNLDKAGKLML